MSGVPRIDLEIVDVRDLADIHVRDDAVRANPATSEIAPALGRRNRHSTAKARAVLDWQPRPARDSVVDCARSLFTHGAA